MTMMLHNYRQFHRTSNGINSSSSFRDMGYGDWEFMTIMAIMTVNMTAFSEFPCRGIAISVTWWRHQMETFSASLDLCAGNSLVTGKFPAQRPVTWSFDVFFDLHLKKRLGKQSWGWWFETTSHTLWCHCNERIVVIWSASPSSGLISVQGHGHLTHCYQVENHHGCQCDSLYFRISYKHTLNSVIITVTS